ncbi:MAG: carboxymuconolactone decarboxylase family protein [Flavobacteriales bacterium]
MPLVNPTSTSIRQGDSELEALVKLYEETLGFCPNSVLTMYHRPAIAYAFIELNKAVMENKGKVTSHLKRLVGYASSYATGCRYCQAHTIRAAERYGAEARQLAEVWEFETSDAFTEAERAALAFSIAASSVPNAVDETIQARMRAQWDDGEIVEILGVIALFGYLNRWNDSMGTTLEAPAEDSGTTYLSQKGWSRGKHV